MSRNGIPYRHACVGECIVHPAEYCVHSSSRGKAGKLSAPQSADEGCIYRNVALKHIVCIPCTVVPMIQVKDKSKRSGFGGQRGVHSCT